MLGDDDQVAGDNGELPPPANTPDVSAAVPPEPVSPPADPAPAAPIEDPVGENDEKGD